MVMNVRKGFTLVEILIVVVILAILAVIVIPQFSQASSESNLTNLAANLQTMRSQIQLYKVQHRDLFPGQAVIGGDINEANFITALTTNDGTYGPYIKQIPKNIYLPFATQRTLTFVNDPTASPTGNEGTAWWFNAANGDFRACDSLEHASM